jgi:glycosyltransferase involved in cell wall biosynthesis
MAKKTILHIINDLGRGGAETMLVTVVKELSDYNNIILTLFPKNYFKDEVKCDKYYCLNLTSVLQVPFKTGELKKIIKENNVDIVHSHLFWSTMLARIGTPKNIPLLTTIHAFIATSLDYKIWHIRFLDRLTYKLRNSIIIAVAKGALKEYFSLLKLKPYKAYTLYTFADIKIFNRKNVIPKDQNENVFRLISVGALRKQKNHKLDIYGRGPLKEELKQFIKDNDLNINLMGEVKNIETIITQYDLFAMSSIFEGFSLGVLEAMAMKMPLLLSDINSFREQCENTAQYFDLNNVNNFVNKLHTMSRDKNNLNLLGSAAYERVINNFTLEHHMHDLRKIYSEALYLT